MIRVCSGFNPSGRIAYGDRFLSSFDRYWPREVELRVYVEEMFAMPRAAGRLLWDIPGARETHALTDTKAYRGIKPVDQKRAKWKPRDIANRYNFKFDAHKFWKQILIPQASAEGMADDDILIWLDGDVETIAPVPTELLDRAIGDDDVAFLGREPKHSEIGFWALRISPRGRQFLASIADMYVSGAFADLPEWHSAYVWDYVRRRSGLQERNLCPPGARGHVFPKSILGAYLRHDKGKRKPGGKRL